MFLLFLRTQLKLWSLDDLTDPTHFNGDSDLTTARNIAYEMINSKTQHSFGHSAQGWKCLKPAGQLEIAKWFRW